MQVVSLNRSSHISQDIQAEADVAVLKDWERQRQHQRGWIVSEGTVGVRRTLLDNNPPLLSCATPYLHVCDTTGA